MQFSLDYLFNTMVDAKTKVLWTFGYGSLIWKPGFDFNRRIVGYIRGYKRRFFQGTTTHRGTPEWPGRVATIIKSNNDDDIVWGVAYEISDESQINHALEHLAEREMITGGYHFDKTLFYSQNKDIEPVEMYVYIADSINNQFLGAGTLEDQAYQIARAEGVCGRNVEYVYRVADFMNEEVKSETIEINDKYLFNLVKLIREFDENQRQPSNATLSVVPFLVKVATEDTILIQMKRRHSA